jgi:hypothetical protein
MVINEVELLNLIRFFSLVVLDHGAKDAYGVPTLVSGLFNAFILSFIAHIWRRFGLFRCFVFIFEVKDVFALAKEEVDNIFFYLMTRKL